MEWPFNALALPASFYACLATAFASLVDTSTIAGCTLATEVNGYTHTALAKNTTDFPAITQDDAGDKATIKIRNLVWTAAGGNLPSTTGATYLVLTSGVTGGDDTLAFWTLGAARQVSDTQQLQVNAAEIDLTE